ncbi:hypothetical protein JCM10295v2_001052 [Rhodotorula toruloides]
MAIVAGPMGRSVLDGRTWKGFDEQEYLRIGVAGSYFPSNKDTTISSVIDDTMVHSLAVRRGRHMMSAYNKLNGTLASESRHALVDLLKVEVLVLSVTGELIEAAKNGLDFVEGAAPASSIWGAALGAAIQNGSLPKDIIDGKIVRMLRPYCALDQQKLPPVNIKRKILNKKSTQTVLDIAKESIMLLKNARTKKDKRGLPLEEPTDILIVGPQAVPGPYDITSNFASAFFAVPTNDYNGKITDGFGSGGSPAPYAVDALTGISERVDDPQGHTFVY